MPPNDSQQAALIRSTMLPMNYRIRLTNTQPVPLNSSDTKFDGGKHIAVAKEMPK